MIDTLRPIFEWIQQDYKSFKIRFILECIAWAMSICCSVVMALTVPNPPLLVLYPLWIAACAVYSWAAWTRRSFGMLANYILLTSIDIIGMARLVAAV